jgi:outer membrane murein-binding lipoprotein Lpp
MKFWLAGVLGALVVAGCASKQALPQVQQGVDAKGVKTVTVAPEKVQCSRPQCPTLAAS